MSETLDEALQNTQKYIELIVTVKVAMITPIAINTNNTTAIIKNIHNVESWFLVGSLETPVVNSLLQLPILFQAQEPKQSLLV